MAKERLLIIVLLLCFGCGEDRDFTQCILEEAIVSYPDPQGGRELTEKYIYFHDGENYTEIHAYLSRNNDGTFFTEPNFIMNLSYQQERIIEVIFNVTNAEDTYTRHSYTYEESIVIKRVANIVNGVQQWETITEEICVPSPTNGTYLFVNPDEADVLAIFENGNLSKFGFQDSDGTHVAYDTTWTFFITYGYDLLPNTAQDFAYQYHLKSPNMGYSLNNMTETRLHGAPDHTIIHRQSYELLAGKWLKNWTYESTGRSIAFSYSCK